MSQSVTSAYSAQCAQPSKALDYAFVIAGWPTIYTVAKDTYTLAGDLAPFSRIHAWANVPSGAAAKIKKRPEEGAMTIGELEIQILDRQYGGVREISDLCSREAYLEGTAPGQIAHLGAGITAIYTTELLVDSTSGFPNSGVVYVGQECIAYASKTGTQFQTLTRGALLTSATAHAASVNAYSFMPSIYRRKAFLYKGFQNLTLDNWARGFAGVISGASKTGALAKLSLSSTTFETFTEGRKLFGRSPNPGHRDIHFGGSFAGVGSTNNHMLGGDFSGVKFNVEALGNLDNGHYVANVGGTYIAVTGAV